MKLKKIIAIIFCFIIGFGAISIPTAKAETIIDREDLTITTTKPTNNFIPSYGKSQYSLNIDLDISITFWLNLSGLLENNNAYTVNQIDSQFNYPTVGIFFSDGSGLRKIGVINHSFSRLSALNSNNNVICKHRFYGQISINNEEYLYSSEYGNGFSIFIELGFARCYYPFKNSSIVGKISSFYNSSSLNYNNYIDIQFIKKNSLPYYINTFSIPFDYGVTNYSLTSGLPVRGDVLTSNLIFDEITVKNINSNYINKQYFTFNDNYYIKDFNYLLDLSKINSDMASYFDVSHFGTTTATTYSSFIHFDTSNLLLADNTLGGVTDSISVTSPYYQVCDWYDFSSLFGIIQKYFFIIHTIGLKSKFFAIYTIQAKSNTL